MFKRLWKKEDGQVLVMVALLLGVLLAFAALVIDVGTMYVAKREMQTAADAGALAGAQELPNAGDAKGKANDYAKKNGGEIVTPNTPYNGDSNKIEVVSSKKVNYIFANIFEPGGSANISARAVAMKVAEWDGKALPFINLTFNYLKEDPTAWTHVGGGIKGTLSDFYTINSGTAEVYFKLEYKDGLTVIPGFSNGTKGLDGSKLKDGLDIVLEGTGNKVYLFSLRANIIDQGKFTVNNKTKTVSLDKLNKLNNGDSVDPHQLVLIECEVLDYKKSNKHDINLLYLNKVYDLGNDDSNNPLPDFPTDYITTGAGLPVLIQ